MARPSKRSINAVAATTPSAATSIAPPFSAASDRLQPFLDLLDPAKVYIVHLDKLPVEFKRQIFAVPVLMNILIVVGLLWRWYIVVPKYLQLTTIIAGVNDPALAGVGSTFREKSWLTISRALMFAIDFFLIKIILPWPISFFLEQPANPVKWRRKVPFQDVEIIVRESRKWGAEELLQGQKVGEESPFFRARVLPGVEKNFLGKKTGYSMMGKDWDLDFANMINAAVLLEQKTLKAQDFEATVFAHDQARGWLEWVVYREEESTEDADRAKLVAFKVTTYCEASKISADTL
jgi:hypothetical protein